MFFDKAFACNIKQVLAFHFYEIIVNFNRLDESASSLRQNVVDCVTCEAIKSATSTFPSKFSKKTFTLVQLMLGYVASGTFL